MTPKQILRTAHQYGYWSGRTVEMTSYGILQFAQIIMDAERQECETCAAKRAKLTEAGLLKSPMREAK